MDIRDVSQNPPVVENGKYLEEIYDLQKTLVDLYIKIESLPQYPIEVNTKKSQVILKDFTGRVIEELAEGFESHLLVNALTDSNRFWVNEDGTSKDYNLMINHLQNLNEEEADAMHFYTEMLIYCNIQPEDIQSWMVKFMKENDIISTEDFSETDIIQNAMLLASMLFNQDINSIHPIHLTKWVEPEKLSYLPGGRYLTHLTLEHSTKILWAVTFTMNISRNCLKNKPWKQSGVMTDENLYQSKLVEGFVYMLGYFSQLGMTSADIYYLYFKKNMINRFRVNSKY